MDCYTYRSAKKDGAYLYMAQPCDYDNLPDELKKMFGNGIFMLRFDLYPTRKNAKVKAQDVITALENQGYFLRIDSVDERDNLVFVKHQKPF